MASAAMLHDLGRGALSPDIREFCKDLSEKDLEALHNHPLNSKQIVESCNLQDLVCNEVLDMITQHHERLDGSGYPQGISHLEISPLTRILNIADQFDLLTMKSGDHPGMKPFDAINSIIEEKEKFDKNILQIFIKSLGRTPKLENS